MNVVRTPIAALTLISIISVTGGCSDPNRSAPNDANATSVTPVQHDNHFDRPRILGTVPDFSFTSQANRTFTNRDLHGTVAIVTFIFTRCTATCPAQTAEFVRYQNRIRKDPAWTDVRLLSITVDPEHDSVDVLAAYADSQAADTAQWNFLTGNRDSIWSLCKNGFKLPVSGAQETPNQVIAHSQQFILVDRVGRIRGYYDGLNEKGLEKLNRDVEYVLDDPKWPVWKRKVFAGDDTQPGQVVYQPAELRDVRWLAERAEKQLTTLPRFRVHREFQYVDRQPESGITFENEIVDDAGVNFKAVHYDHGTGVTVADVDGDGMLDIYFVSQRGRNQLWRNLGSGRFEDITAASGTGLADRIGVTASFADTDNDGDADLFVTTVRGGNVLFENVGGGQFHDITTESGLSYTGHSSAAVFFDYNRDGLLDLFVCNVGDYTTDETGDGGYFVGREDGFHGQMFPERAEPSRLYRNLGGNRFEDASETSGLVDESWTGDASPLDFNEDGWPDLYVLSMQGHDEFYENVRGTFVRRSRERFPRTPWGSMGIKVFDFDNDDRLDIYVTDMHTDMIDDLQFKRRFWWAEKLKMTETYPEQFLNTDGNHILGNAFFRNNGNGEYLEVSDQIGAETYWPWGISTGDLNADGWEDVFVTGSMNYPFRYGINSVLLNNEGREFLDSEFIVGVEPRPENRTSMLWFELDCDNVDENNPGSVIHCRDRTGTIQVHAALGSRSSVIFDLDEDGDLDIVTNEFNSVPQVLVSNLTDTKSIHYLKIGLEGVDSNRDALGAIVRVSVAGRTLTKPNDGVSGYLAHSRMPLYFGLDDADQVDSIEVVWPSGNVQAIEGPIPANQLVTVTEKQAP